MNLGSPKTAFAYFTLSQQLPIDVRQHKLVKKPSHVILRFFHSFPLVYHHQCCRRLLELCFFLFKSILDHGKLFCQRLRLVETPGLDLPLEQFIKLARRATRGFGYKEPHCERERSANAGEKPTWGRKVSPSSSLCLVHESGLLTSLEAPVPFSLGDHVWDKETEDNSNYARQRGCKATRV